MADRAYPQPPFPATKGQLYNRPIYRQQPPPRRCRCCCYLLIAILSIIFLAGLAGGIFYAIFRPHRPTFSISSLSLSALNTNASGHLTSRLNITVTARNPNRKITYLYDQISFTISSGGAGIGEGSFPGFVHGAKSTHVMSSTAATAADLKRSSIQLEIGLETKAGMKVGRMETKKVGIKIYCRGIEIASPKGKKAPPAAAATVDSSCEAKLRMKIWKWTI